MKLKYVLVVYFVSFFVLNIFGQVTDEETRLREQQSSLPRAINFDKLLQGKNMTREEFLQWKRQREINLRERISNMEALETAVDPDLYIVGPDDGFSFNIWGAMETRIPLSVTPEGKLLVPSVGEIDVNGKTLAEVQKLVVEKSSEAYANSKVTLTLDILRLFRVHVVGEVRFPGTYIAQAVNRISEVITEAGGVTERAWKGGIILKHADGTEKILDLNRFELKGDLSNDLFVNGGDVIYVPPVSISGSTVQLEADQEYSGTYQISEGENLLSFLHRIRALKRNTDMTKILVIRFDSGNKNHYFSPFGSDKDMNDDFRLESGDRIILPSHYVYVKGAVQTPGAYPFVFNMTAKDYAGMAGGNYRSGNIKGIKVYHVKTGNTEKGAGVLVEPGDVVHVQLSLGQKIVTYLPIISATTSLVLAAKAAGLFGK